jgi:hypothetical protein
MSDSALEAPKSDTRRTPWTRRLVFFLRLMAAASMVKGLYHWSLVLGVGDGSGSTFEQASMPWQAATIFFAVIDLVAAVGLWLAAPWGAVIWLTSVVSMAAVEILFPQIFGGSVVVIGVEFVLLVAYIVLAILAAREQPN